MESYSEEYFKRLDDKTLRSAQAVVPLILEFVQPHSVIDVGCGTGAWLAVFEEHGAKEVVGVDGRWAATDLLHIREEQFLEADLRNSLRLDRKFDLVISLEVAEHLPADCADTFVDTLTCLGPFILFSAAVPHQGGTNHVNEQWPAYWIKRFLDRDYVAVDCLRRKIWGNEQVAWWYAQNALCFVHQDHLDEYPRVKKEYDKNRVPLSVVHPGSYLALQEQVETLQREIYKLEAWGGELKERVAKQEKQVEALWELRPGHMPLSRVLRALPALVKHALTQRLGDDAT